MNRTCWPLDRIGVREIGASAVGIVFEIESVTSVWRPEPTARRTPAREVRRLEHVPMVPSFAVEAQAAKAVITLGYSLSSIFDWQDSIDLLNSTHKTDTENRFCTAFIPGA
jgi:hypothetical protein